MQNKGNALRMVGMLSAILLSGLFTLFFGILLAPQDGKLAEMSINDLTFNDNWTLALPDGTETPATLPWKVQLPPNTPVSIYKTLDNRFDNAMCISYINLSQTVSVTVDDTLVFNDVVRPNQLIGKTPPPGRSYVRLHGNNVGKTLTLTFCSSAENLGGGIDIIHAGTGIQLFFFFCKNYFPRLLCDLAILGTGIFLIVFGLFIRNAGDLRYTSVYLGSFAVLFASFLRYGTASFPFMYITTFYAYMTGVLSLILCVMPLLLYYHQKAHSRFKSFFSLLFWCYLVNFTVVLMLQLLQLVDLVASLASTHILLLITILAIVAYHLNELRLHSPRALTFENMGLLSMIILCGFDLLFYKLNPLYRVGVFARLGIMSYLLCMVTSVVRAVSRREQEYRNNEQQRHELETRLMLSQLSPHFIYNSLTSIRYLCESDTSLAVQTIDTFSEFLRGVLESLGKKQMIPFENDLEHVRSYLAIEQVRFGALLRVRYDVAVTDFVLPALTMQPLVENAVRHGVTKRDEGGTITLATRRKGEDVIITISDDGVGFVPEQLQPSDCVHVGLTNVRKRIEMMCDGTLSLNSAPDVGTTVTICLRERKIDDEDSGSR